jgi:hypothetical protein
MTINTTLPPTKLERFTAEGRRSASVVSYDSSSASAQKTNDKDDAFSFWDLVDAINPLQHIPLVNNLYRNLTGDKIGSFARIAGGGLFGGFIGAALGGVNAIVAHETGQDMGEMAFNVVTGNKGTGKEPPNDPVARKDLKDLSVIEVRPLAERNVNKEPHFVLATQDLRSQIIWDNGRDNDPALPDKMMQALIKYQELQNSPKV